MKAWKIISIVYLLLNSLASYAFFPVPSNTTTPQPNRQTPKNKDLSAIANYLQNLGQYFGYDLNQYCQSGGPCGDVGSGPQYSNALLDENFTSNIELNFFNTFIGSLFGGGNEDSLNPLVSKDNSAYAFLNALGGQTFIDPPYSAPSSNGVTASAQIDQAVSGGYLADPVNQALLNLLSTPNMSYCFYSTDANGNCQILYREKILVNVVGELRKTQQAFTGAVNSSVVPQLNSEALMAPLLLTTTNANSSPTSSGSDNTDSKNAGLTAKSQAQQAANFVRYAINAVNPLMLPSREDYDLLISKALNYDGSTKKEEQISATVTLSNYFVSLRSYAAQLSVPIGNLYYMLSRRLPQKPASGSNNDTPSSEALNEFIMATWRLYTPNNAAKGGNSQQWINRINKASQSTTQKEIAILLAEINYQLYLSRIQQERILLTESIMLIQQAQGRQPRANFKSTAGKINSATESTGAGPQ